MEKPNDFRTTRSLVGKQKAKREGRGKMDETSTGETKNCYIKQLSERRRDKNWHNYKRQKVNIQVSSMHSFML